MERIFYNNKLKKISIISALIILMSNVYLPVISLATADDPEVMDSKHELIVEVRNILEELGEKADEKNWVPKDLRIDDTQIDIPVGQPIDTYMPGVGEITDIAGEEEYNRKIDEIYERQKDLPDEEKLTAREAADEALDGALIAVENTYKEIEENTADIGGILLSPIFYLINFIADTVIESMGNLMTGEGMALGIGVLQRAETPPVEGKTYHEVPINTTSFGLSIQYPNIKYTPEEIFAGKIDLLSIDFISGKVPDRDDNGNIKYDANGDVIYKKNSDDGWNSIRKVISDWYKVIRMIAIIGLLSVLIYTGIKIIISANAKDKAKYKEWIINWFLAVAILFAMHYIMAFVISVTTEFSALLSNASQGIKIIDTNELYEHEKVSVTNLMGLVRFMIQSENFYIKVGYEIMYIALITYTVKFTMTYLKRVLNMAFLTLIAPIVALTYPIDKINDGKAQGFDMWLKEYIFNALLQPMHQLMYYVLVGSAVSIAASNPIYGIVVLAFMAEAEKLLKKIFGFDKASGGTVGGMAGAFAAGAVASNISKMFKMPGGNAGKGGDGNLDEQDVLNIAKPTNPPDGSSFSVGNSNVGTTTEDNPSTESRSNSQLPIGGDENDDSENESRTSFFEDPDDPDMTGVYGDTTFTPSETTQVETQNEPANSTVKPAVSPQPVDDMAKDKEEKRKKSKFEKGMANVGKTLLRPIWDLDKSGKYNGKRWARKIGRAALGTGMGIAAAAVQAGISITDGKYNPMEGVAAFGAGYAGGRQVVSGAERLGRAYIDGADAGNKVAIMKRAQESFRNNDKVIAHYKKEYGDNWKKQLERAKDNYVTRGVKDTGDQKRCIKFADNEDMRTKYGWSSDEEADKYAADTLDFRDTLKEQGQLSAVNDLDKRTKYIDSICKGKSTAEANRLRAEYNRKFDAVSDFNSIVF